MRISVKSAVLSLAAIMAITGCGSDSDSSTTSTTPSATTVSGSAVDGYLSGATICLDENGDGVCNGTEPTATTNEVGGYSLTLSAAQKASGKPLLVYGGVDVSTGERFSGKLRAVVEGEAVNVTPLTTMIEAVYANGGTVAQAKNKVATALNVDVADLTADPVALFDTKPEVMQAALTLQKVVEVLTAAHNAAATQESETVTNQNIFSDLADALSSATTTPTSLAATVTAASTLDGSSITPSVAVVAEVVANQMASLSGETLEDFSLLSDAIAEAIQETTVDAVENNTTSTLEDDAAAAATTAAAKSPTVIALENLFDTYEIAASPEEITAIETALNGASVTMEHLRALELPKAIALVAAYDAEVLAAKVAIVQAYIEDTLQLSAPSSLVMEAIAELEGFTSSLSKEAFVALLRASGEEVLVAFADEIDPPVVATFDDISTIYGFYVEHNGEETTLVRNAHTLNNGTLTATEEYFDLATCEWKSWTRDPNYQLVNGVWTLSDDTAYAYTLSDDRTIMTLDGSVQVKLQQIIDVAGETISPLEGSEASVTFSSGAQAYTLLFKEAEGYELNWTPTNWETNATYSSLQIYISDTSSGAQCIYHRESDNACVGIPSSVDLSQTTSGNLALSIDGQGQEVVVGTWSLGNLPGQTGNQTLLFDVNDSSFLEDNEERFVTVYNGTLYQGGHWLASEDFEASSELSGNYQAMQDISDQLTAQCGTNTGGEPI